MLMKKSSRRLFVEFPIFFYFFLLIFFEVGEQVVVKIKEVAVVVFHRLITAGLDFLGGCFDLFFDLRFLFFGEAEEAGESLHGESFPVPGVVFVTGCEGTERSLIPAFFFTEKEADPVTTEEDCEECDKDGQVIAEGGFHGADGKMGGSGRMMGSSESESLRRKR